ncbi:unnamed protein product [Rhizophagus irregularis]|nr:unnamed protein product [Rhizophagus irregularis]
MDQAMLNEDESSDQKDEVINITEDYYDFRQAYLNALLNSISRESIDKIWRIVLYIAFNLYQHIIIFNDALFHVMLMLSRWLHDDAWKNNDYIYCEPFINSSSQNVSNTNNEQIFNPRYYNNVQEV